MIDAAKSGSERAVQPILELQRRWVEALLKADTEALDAILVDSYVDTDESGFRLDKTGILAALESGDLKLESITTTGDAGAQACELGSIDRHVSPKRDIPGQTHRAENTFYRYPGFA